MSTPTSNSVAAERITLPADPDLSSLLHGSRWVATGATTSLTYSFPINAGNWANPYSPLNEPSTGGVIPLDAAAATGAVTALQLWSRYANISFAATSDTGANVGDIRFAYTRDEDAAAHAYLPSSGPAAGDIWLDSTTDFGGFERGSFGLFTLLHEVGHALGLKHPFESSTLNEQILDPELDSVNSTVMSYNLYSDLPASDYGISYLPTTPMQLDIEAVQALYGARPFNTDDNEYVFNSGSQYFETIYDSGGNDTIIWNSSTEEAVIDLESGSWSALGDPLITFDRQGEVVKVDYFTVAIFSETMIENATGGGGDDLIYGNAVANRLLGSDGHDDIFGYEGADTLVGGAGNDHLYGRAASGGADGEDSLSGGAGSDYLQGNAGNDMLDGGEGSDRINGGGSDDSIFGGAGNDTVNGNLGSDVISGGDGDDSLRGGQGADSISGGTGNDILSGDLGEDILSGGDGNDLFVVGGSGSPLAQPDRILDFTDGTDRVAIGFAPAAILTGAAQANAGAAATAAQQLLDNREGNGEVAALAVGADTYLFYASNGGGMIDSAIVVVGIAPQAFGVADFG